MSTSRHMTAICITAAILAVVFTCAILLAGANGAFGAAEGKTLGYEDKIFDTSKVHTIDIQMDDWDEFIDTCTSEEYSPCSITIDGETYDTVGIRGKGNTSLSTVASLNSDRYSFKVEFDQYSSGVSYHGLDKLSLNNTIQDTTYMKDYLTYRAMGAFGVDAPLCSFAWITVNGEDWGLYLVVEGVEESFLQRNYGSGYGELYKPDSMSFGGGRGNGAGFDMGKFEFDDNGDLKETDEEGSGSSKASEDSGEAADANANEEKSASPESAFPSFSGTPPNAGGGGSNPGSDRPSFDGEMPEFSGEAPDFNGEIPDFDGEMPDFNGEAPDFNGEIPDFSGEPPSSMGEIPSFSDESTNSSDEASSSSSEFPNLSDETPSSSGESSGSERKRPSFGGGMPGFGGMGSNDVRLQYIDDDPESYSNIFNNAKTVASAADKNRLIASLKQLSSYENLEEVVDIDEVIRYFVVHDFVCNGDSYTGGMVHNYYLYEDDGKLSMIPWDYNLAFGTFQASSDATSTVNAPIDTPVSDGNVDNRPMVGWIFSSEEYTDLYHELYAAFLEEVDLQELIDETVELIEPYVKKDPSAFYSYDEFQSGVSALKSFCELRSESVSGQLDGSIPSTKDGQAADSSALIDGSDLKISDMGSMGGKGGRGAGPGAGPGQGFPGKGESGQSRSGQGGFKKDDAQQV